jgi:hypothetical protein
MDFSAELRSYIGLSLMWENVEFVYLFPKVQIGFGCHKFRLMTAHRDITPSSETNQELSSFPERRE